MTTERPGEQPGNEPAIDEAWRRVSNESPPAHLDAAILVAARAEAARGTPRRPDEPAGRRRWTRWQPLAAAAGVGGLAFVLVQMIPRDDVTRPPTANETMEAARERAPQVATDTPSTPSAPLGTETRASAPSTEAPAPPSAASAPEPPPAQAKTVADRAAASTTQSDRETALADTASGLSAETGDASSGVPGRASSASRAALSPDAWAQRIDALRATGDEAAAVAELQAFRAAWPGAEDRWPDPLRAWAATIPAPAQR